MAQRGNEESLKAFYEAQRHSPILGGKEFVERVRQPRAIVGREHPRYERQAVQAEPERVIREVVRHYRVTREEIFRGMRGRENEARKVALYLVKRCCDRTLPQIAQYFGIGSYSAVSWSCRAILSRWPRRRSSEIELKSSAPILTNSRFDPLGVSRFDNHLAGSSSRP
jgi:Bacterial dnaA protein helix-turn-helix